jgi:GH15 family glucan-1,4-alpha-glucosidase
MVGNFPQAFSHLTLVQAALRLRDAGPRDAEPHA